MYGTLNQLEKDARINDDIYGMYRGDSVNLPKKHSFSNVKLGKGDHFLSFAAMIAPSPDWFVGT